MCKNLWYDLKEVTLVSRTQPSGPLCLGNVCFIHLERWREESVEERINARIAVGENVGTNLGINLEMM